MRIFSIVAACALIGGACGSKPKQTTQPKTQVREHGGERAAAVASREQPATTDGTKSDPAAPRFGAIYFDFDLSELRKEARDTLEELAAYLRANPGAKVTIEGHADERGTPEYNQALGEERARVARDYLVRLGVERDRVTIVSYGEERPAESGAGEAAWSKNRRDEFRVTASRAASR